jgi:hypothetical protein
MSKKKRKPTKRDTAQKVYTTIYRRYTKGLGATIKQIAAWRHISKTTTVKYVKVLQAKRLVSKLDGKWFYIEKVKEEEAKSKRPREGFFSGPPVNLVMVACHAKLSYKSHRANHSLYLEAQLVRMIDPNSQSQKAALQSDLEKWLLDNDFSPETIEMCEFGFSDGEGKSSVIKYSWDGFNWRTIRGK